MIGLPAAERLTVREGVVRPWDATGYQFLDARKAKLAKRLLHWLAQSEVREYVSPNGYRMLIIGREQAVR